MRAIWRSTTLENSSKKMTWERVLGVLKERGMTNCIRIREEVDKEALRTLGPNTLADVGCKLTQEDAFFYERNEAELEGSRAWEGI